MVASTTARHADNLLAGRTLYIPQMAYPTARLTAAAFRSIGVDARPAPPSDDQTLALGGLHASGEECLPHKITLGDFLKVTRQPDFNPRRVAFFMPSAPGPCRFGQYGPFLRKTLDELGHHEALVFSPSSRDGYAEVGNHASTLMRAAWLAIVTADILLKLLLKTRPYETTPGAADQAFEAGLDDVEQVLAAPHLKPRHRLTRLVTTLHQVRNTFRNVPARYEKGRPLIGLVGEIFCRLNTFSNEDAARRIEQLGGECWLSDISEWIWYTNWCHEADCRREHGRLNTRYARLMLKSLVQHGLERKLLAPFRDDFLGYEEPADVREVLRYAEPYLPATGALGEMTLSVGKAIYLFHRGADGVIDISPFSCMNGIVSEAVYPAVSADCNHLPIRALYFDKTHRDLECDLEIFLDLARAYQSRKRKTRRYPACFG